jgi:hypothetical protein
MNAEIERQLKVHVERCVRPIRAANLRKDRMRRELFSHLSDAFAQERQRVDDDQRALRQSLARFGDVGQVRDELQASVSRWEQFLFQTLEPPGGALVCPRRRPDEPALRFTLRRALVGGLLYFLLMCLTFGIVAALSGGGTRPWDRSRLLLLVASAAVGGVMLSAAILMNHVKVSAILRHGYLSRGSLWATLVSVAGLTLCVLGLLALCNAMAKLPIFAVASPVWVAAAALIVGALFECVAVLSIWDRRRSDEWESLALGER